jgi:hypothetical protein
LSILGVVFHVPAFGAIKRSGIHFDHFAVISDLLLRALAAVVIPFVGIPIPTSAVEENILAFGVGAANAIPARSLKGAELEFLVFKFFVGQGDLRMRANMDKING